MAERRRLDKDPELLSTSRVSAWLGFNVSVAFLDRIGIEPAFQLHGHITYWRRADLPAIRDAIIDHLGSLTGDKPNG